MRFLNYLRFPLNVLTRKPAPPIISMFINQHSDAESLGICPKAGCQELQTIR